MTDVETRAVAFELRGIEMVRGAGKLVALAIVDLDIAGVVMTIQGVQVLREPSGALTCRAPQFRDASGVWRSAVLLPDTLRDALGCEVLASHPSLAAP